MNIEHAQAAQSMALEDEQKTSKPIDQVASLIGFLRAIHMGDEHALEHLYEQTVNHVHALVTRILGKGPDAEEVTEDVYLYIWRNSHRYDADQGHPLAWMITLARSRAIDRFRYREKHKRIAGALALEPANDAYVEEDSLTAAHGKSLHECIANLPHPQRQILTLAYFRGLTQSEIADSLGMSLGTVKTHIRRTLIALRLEVEA